MFANGDVHVGNVRRHFESLLHERKNSHPKTAMKKVRASGELGFFFPFPTIQGLYELRFCPVYFFRTVSHIEASISEK